MLFNQQFYIHLKIQNSVIINKRLVTHTTSSRTPLFATVFDQKVVVNSFQLSDFHSACQLLLLYKL